MVLVTVEKTIVLPSVDSCGQVYTACLSLPSELSLSFRPFMIRKYFCFLTHIHLVLLVIFSAILRVWPGPDKRNILADFCRSMND